MTEKQIEGAKIALLAGILAFQALSYFQDKLPIEVYSTSGDVQDVRLVGQSPIFSLHTTEDTPPGDDVMAVCIYHKGSFPSCDDEIDVGRVSGN